MTLSDIAITGEPEESGLKTHTKTDFSKSKTQVTKKDIEKTHFKTTSDSVIYESGVFQPHLAATHVLHASQL